MRGEACWGDVLWGFVHIRLFALASSQHRKFEECRKRLCSLRMQVLCTPARCPSLTNGILPWHCVFHESEMATSSHDGSANSGFLLFSTLYTDNVFFYQNLPRSGIISLGHKITCSFYRVSAFLPSYFVLFHMYHHIHGNFVFCLTPRVF